DAQGVLRALLLGDRSRVTDVQRERFVKTGLMHLLAVSGLHVFLVGMVLYALLRPFLIRFGMQWRTVEIARAALTILVLGGYMFLTGGRPSVVRAVIMATLFIGGIVFQRSAHPLNTLGGAALILLAVRPPALFDVGFQLSMSAVAGIVTLNPRLLDAIPERYRASEAVDWLVSTGTVSAAAILGTAPVLLFHFGWVSAAGLLLNIAGIPCTGLALSAAILMAVTGGMWSLAGASFGSAADVFVQGLLATSRYGVEWLSWAGIRMATPDAWGLGALVAALIALTQWPRPHLRWR
ncbi:MAG: DNA internalization-related competence protein ComEC/Rec2, partial [Bacteroidetes bacterium QS_1_63_11]